MLIPEATWRLPLASTVFVVALMIWSLPASSNSAAAGIAANGIYLKDEKNISIEREDLYVSEHKIAVTYIFKNHSNTDITTLVAFPIPGYTFDITGTSFRPEYEDFTVEVNGKPIRYSEEVKAVADGVDYSDLLATLNISIKDFGNYEKQYHDKENYFTKLSPVEQEMLLQKKLVVMWQSLPTPDWTVSRKYFWTQSFPAGSETKIKHTYKPYPSFGFYFKDPKRNRSDDNQRTCLTKDGERWLWGDTRQDGYQYLSVDYILTTANNWKQPIKDFRLALDGVKPEGEVLVTTCFTGEKKKTGQNQYEIRLADFLPKENLTVYFIHKEGIGKLEPASNRWISTIKYGIFSILIASLFWLAYVAYRRIFRSK